MVMTNAQMAELHKLPKKEKIELVQLLWEDIARDQEYDALPADHKSILNDRLEKIDQGKGEFVPWEQIRKKYYPSR
ncbi:MAG: addiction module protein [Bacteroidetes bacterium]|nr:addiction module protein [Bacteroidota bacterium]